MRPCPSSSGLAKAHMATTERHEDRVHPIFSDDRSRSRRSPRHPFHMQAHTVNILTALQPCSQSAVPTRFRPQVQSFPMGVRYCMVMLRTAGKSESIHKNLSRRPVWAHEPSATRVATSRMPAAANVWEHGEDPIRSCSGTCRGSAAQEGPKVPGLTSPQEIARLEALQERRARSRTSLLTLTACDTKQRGERATGQIEYRHMCPGCVRAEGTNIACTMLGSDLLPLRNEVLIQISV